MQSYRYVVNFVDHKSRLGTCYFLRSKDEVVDKFKLFVAEMTRFGIIIRNLQSDRGSENYAQEGATHASRDRALSALDKYCLEQGILHNATCISSYDLLRRPNFNL